ncbi:MAG: thioredoxin [Roseibium album]|uniref:Thioredoxin n=2 Tax=Roseibium album TaxID=311410 RepID=A0A0M6ZV77_9HYPH|nr:thioredoxin [Roseibium album]MBG6144129.1 putative thioredoxin [Labrenzia sp. EL_142]MBG6157400.1 putative thioredoxin [Labrenzia sp. EL_162]MBG6162830.1 putative thioredoxin [Labrenzia sp. EL_195]MBG6174776.1 putative thioredoxin [Labrenzia sp. EL_132]MBG6196206.1 putative thioredoxin [Labrenzia sp. EL_159]MBG6201635.1 putative thioredoxin [Labrenzia sp. EL_13]MBG6228942.1 putative thioredoxin [Labrenzia sp. EL_208]
MSNGNYSVGGQVGGGFGASMGGGYGGQGGGFGGDGGNGGPTGGSGPTGGDLIFDVTTQTFMADVLEASRQQPVLVDFWAPWCGPCKQLTPIIEAAVKAAGGTVRLAKMNIDDHPEIAGQMGIQSIPAVVAFKDGQPVDGFMGAQQESQVKAFIEKLGGPAPANEADAYLEQATELLAANDFAQAAQLFGAVMQMEPENVKALAGLAQCYLGADELERAKQALELVPEDKRSDEAYTAAVAALDLAEQAASLGDLAEFHNRIASNPLDHQARFDLALGLNGKGDKEGAVDQLIEIVRNDREWNEDGARMQLLQFFEAWGFKDPASNYGRRKLSAVLFS